MRAFPDTNVWIAWGVAGQPSVPPRGRERYELFLTTIALQELWAGVRSPREARDLQALFDAAHRRRRLANPPAAAWLLAGRALHRLARRRRIRAARLRAMRNDVLLAATAVAHGAVVLTYNRADFALIRRVLPVRFLTPA